MKFRSPLQVIIVLLFYQNTSNMSAILPTMTYFKGKLKKLKFSSQNTFWSLINLNSPLQGDHVPSLNYKAVTSYLDPYLLRDFQNVKDTSIYLTMHLHLYHESKNWPSYACSSTYRSKCHVLAISGRLFLNAFIKVAPQAKFLIFEHS